MICKITQLSKILLFTCFLISGILVAQEPGVPTGLQIISNNPNEFTLTWDADPLATGGFNIAIVGANGSDVWVKWGYSIGSSYTYSGTYGSGASAITIIDGNEYTVKLQAQPDADYNAYAGHTFTLNVTGPVDPGVPSGLQTISNNPNEFTLTWNADALAIGGFNIAIVGADNTDIWVEWGYSVGTSYTFSGTYGSGSSAITIIDGNEYTVKLQAQPDSDYNAYAGHIFTLNQIHPNAPTGLTLSSPAANQYKMIWDNDSNATGFNISIVEGGTNIYITTLGAGTTEYTYSGTYSNGTNSINVVDGGTYTFVIQALPDNDGVAYASVSTSALSTDKFDSLGFSMYPSPASDLLSIKGSNLENVKISIYSLVGRHIKTAVTTNVDVSELISGLYLVIIENEKGQKITRKFVKK